MRMVDVSSGIPPGKSHNNINEEYHYGYNKPSGRIVFVAVLVAILFHSLGPHEL